MLRCIVALAGVSKMCRKLVFFYNWCGRSLKHLCVWLMNWIFAFINNPEGLSCLRCMRVGGKNTPRFVHHANAAVSQTPTATELSFHYEMHRKILSSKCQKKSFTSACRFFRRFCTYVFINAFLTI